MNSQSQSGLKETKECSAKLRLKAPAVPVLDPADYAEDMAEFDMTEDQKREFLETLWSILRAFAEMGFTVDVCGQLFVEFNDVSKPEQNDVKFNDSTNTGKPAGKESSP